MNSKKLLKEYIHQVLKEDGEYVTPGGEGSPYGMSWGSSEDLVSTFITPFTDVFKTAVGQTKEITRKARTTVALGFSTIIRSFIPFIGYNYEEIFKKEQEDIESIRNEYKDVYERTNKMLANNDAAFLAFMAAPAATLGFLAAKETPKAIKGLLSVVTGGLSDKVYDEVKRKAEDSNKWGGKSSSKNHHIDIIRRFDKLDRQSNQDSFRTLGSEVTGKDVTMAASAVASELIESIIYENNEEDDEDKNKKILPKDIIKNKTFISKTLSSSKVVKMQKEATKIYKSTLHSVYSEAQKVLKNTHSIEDLEKITKKKVPEAEEIKKLSPEEKAKAEKILIDGIRKSTKDFYIKNLKDHVDGVIKAGIPEESQYVKDYKETIQKIQAL